MKDRLTSKLTALFVAAAMAVPMPAFADADRAEVFYQQATEAYQEGDLRKAADLLERAYAEDPDLVYQYNRILALEGLEDYAEALRVLEIFEEPMKRDAQDRFDDIEEIRDRLIKAKKLEDAKNQPKEEPPEDPKEDDETPEPGELQDPEEPPAKPESGPNILAWSLLGTGVVSATVGGLFAGAIFAGDAADNVSCVSDNSGGADPVAPTQAAVALGECYPSAANYSAAYDTYTSDQDTLSSHQILSIVFISAGAALATTGVVLLLTDSDDESTATLGPYIGSDSAGAVFNLDF